MALNYDDCVSNSLVNVLVASFQVISKFMAMWEIIYPSQIKQGFLPFHSSYSSSGYLSIVWDMQTIQKVNVFLLEALLPLGGQLPDL